MGQHLFSRIFTVESDIGESPLPGEIILPGIILIVKNCFSYVQAESPPK